MAASRWDALDHGSSPFTEHGFLAALERSGSVGTAAGWEPHYVLVEQGADARAEIALGAEIGETQLAGAVAAYVKTHSYGEYIFDWSWARASEQAGLAYYPKLVVAVPMTPATGRRLLVARDMSRGPVVERLIAGVKELAERRGCRSIHWLFTTEGEQAELEAHGFMPRASFQYHWKSGGERDFEAFLGRMTSRRRKQIRKERARVHAAALRVEWVPGSALTAEDVATIDRFYRQTTANHHGNDYLQPGFFEEVVARMGDRVQWARVVKDGRAIAGALYFAGEQALYGRYWGCDEQVEFLHFEAAYYAGIERCLSLGTPLFEAGAQGEHKLIRGFAPAPTYSSHWFRHPGFAAAVGKFLREEARAVHQHMQELATLLPFREEGEGAAKE